MLLLSSSLFGDNTLILWLMTPLSLLLLHFRWCRLPSPVVSWLFLAMVRDSIRRCQCLAWESGFPSTSRLGMTLGCAWFCWHPSSCLHLFFLLLQLRLPYFLPDLLISDVSHFTYLILMGLPCFDLPRSFLTSSCPPSIRLQIGLSPFFFNEFPYAWFRSGSWLVWWFFPSFWFWQS